MLLRAVWIASLLILANVATVQADPTIENITKRYQQKCEEIAASAEWADDDLDTEVTGITRENVYDLKLTPDGKTGTVIYENFGCSDLMGAPWCGSGGCSFRVIVDGMTFDGFGFPPFSVTGHGHTFILFPERHYACETSEGEDTGKPCFGVAVWNEQRQAFVSREVQLKRRVSDDQ